MTDDIDDLYKKALMEELGDPSCTSKVRVSVYDGELAFALQTHCIQVDIPPMLPCEDTSCSYYKFTMTQLCHDMAIYILTSLRDVFPLSECTEYMSGGSYGSRRNRIRKELESLGIDHMGKWLTCCRDGTYTICIRHLRYRECSRLCKVLFSW